MGLKLTDFFKGTDSDNQVSEDYYNILKQILILYMFQISDKILEFFYHSFYIFHLELNKKILVLIQVQLIYDHIVDNVMLVL